MLLHPNKTSNPRAKEAFNIIEEAYQNILNETNKKIYQRIYLEAQGRLNYSQEVENKKY